MQVKLIIASLCIAMFASQAWAQTLEKQILDTMIFKILLEEYENVLTSDGYKFSYKTNDGSVREEVGLVMNPGTEQEELVVMGSYGYVDSEGTRTVTMYTADKNGYRPRVSTKLNQVSPKAISSILGG